MVNNPKPIQSISRLYFDNVSSFRKAYRKAKVQSDADMYQTISHFSPRDFIPLRPVITKENQKFIRTRFLKRKQKFYNEHNFSVLQSKAIHLEKLTFADRINRTENIIGDLTFANFLNAKGEIQISNRIYKYTDVGLFIVNADNYVELDKYLLKNKISRNLLIPSKKSSIKQFALKVPQGGYTQLKDGVTYYRNPSLNFLMLPSDPPTGGGGGGYPDEPVPTIPLNEFIDDLEWSNPRGSTIDLFGDGYKVIKEYDGGKRRIKLKAFDYNFGGIAFHLGVKVKHQYRGWTGIWRKEEVDKIVLGLQSAIYYYDVRDIFASVNINEINLNQNFLSPLNSLHSPGYFEVDMDDWGNVFVSNYVPATYNPYPWNFFDNTELIVELWSYNDIWNKYVLQNVNGALTGDKLNDYFFNTIWSNLSGTLQSITSDKTYSIPKDIVYLTKHPKPGIINFFRSFTYSQNNSAKVEETLDWGIGFTLNLMESNNFSFRLSADGGPLRQPKGFRGSVFGAILSNGKWRGIKFKFK